MNDNIPVRIIKKGQPGSSQLGKKAADPSSEKKQEPQVQLLDHGDGTFDIIVTCRCGEKIAVTCNTPNPSVPPKPA
jgi:hypothetical protein